MRFLFVILMAGLVFAALTALATSHAAPGGVTLTEVQAVADTVAIPPADGFRPERLPHDWDTSLPLPLRDVVWYRASVALSDRNEAWAIVLPKVSMHASVFVGDAWIGGTESGNANIAGVAKRPWIFHVPPALLSDPLPLNIRVSGLPHVRSGLAPIWVGPLSALRPAYEHRFFWQVTLVEWLNAGVLALAFFAAAIWWQRRRETALGWFSLACICWAMASHHSIGGKVPLAEPLASGVAAVAMGAAGLFTLRFAWSFAGATPSWAPRLTWGYLTLGVIAGALFLALSAPVWVTVWLAPLVAVPVLFALLFAYSWGVTRNRIHGALALVGAAGTAIAVHDALLYSGALGFAALPLLPYGSALLALAVAAALARQFVANLCEVESLNRTLEARVEQKHAELEASYARTRELEAEQTRLDERQRLTRDMHDGLGGQLMSALALVDSGKLEAPALAGVLRECIDDMRLLIDSLEPDETDLVALLGNLRYRLAPRFAAAGITLKWAVGESVGPVQMTAESRLNVLRIVQEALTNVLKHARARTVIISTDGHGNLSVSDDGRGIDPHAQTASAGGGHGSRNMARRAERIGARLQREPREGGGTVVNIIW